VVLKKPFYLTVADIDIYIARLGVKRSPLAVPSGVPSTTPSGAPSTPPSTTLSDSHLPSEKEFTTTALPWEDPNTIIAAWAEPCEPKTEARKERYSSEEYYWDNMAGLVMAVRKAMVRTPRRNRLEEGDWVVGYMHRSIMQKEREKEDRQEKRKDEAHGGEVVGDQKMDMNFVTDGMDSDAAKVELDLQALQAEPDLRASQAAPVPTHERYKRITVSGTKRRVYKDAEMYFQDVYPFYGGTSEAVGEMEIWSCRDLGNMKEGDLVTVWVIPEKLMK
jgi:hypothetical protein